MLHIGKTYLESVDGQARLCADISLNGKGTTLWFAVEEEHANYLCADCSDPFIMAFFPMAMRKGVDIVSDTPASARLCYQLENYVMPTVVSAGDMFQSIHIEAPYTIEKIENAGAVGTGFSGGVDSLYTVMTHGQESEFPLTHLAVFNSGVFGGKDYRGAFRKSCGGARRFALENGLSFVGLDTNLPEVFPETSSERFLDVYTYRNMACALALQGLFSVYLVSSGWDSGIFKVDLSNSASYDLLLVTSGSTESLSFYPSGIQSTRVDKIRALTSWDPSHSTMHPCFNTTVGMNCGHCKKCIMDLATLYALDSLDTYEEVFDVQDFRKNLAQRLGVLFACRDTPLWGQAADFVEKSGVHIPQAAYVYEKYFRIGMDNVSKSTPSSQDA